jgi:hypothetical protein
MSESEERAEVDRMHSAISAGLAENFWHRVPLGPGPHHERSVLLAYTVMEVSDDLATAFRFVRVQKTRLTAERAARRIKALDVREEQCRRYDWALETLEGTLVAMPSNEQVEAASVAVAKQLVGDRDVPLALAAFLSTEVGGINRTEFWYPQGAPTKSLWDLFKRRLIRTYL